MSKLDSWMRNVTHRLLGFLEERLALFTLLVLVAEVTFAVLFWCWLSAGESGSTTIRNLGLVVAATIGLPIAIWRSKVAERQAATAQRGLLNERYQKGAEMLGSEVLSVRLGGIYALARLGREHPSDYHTQIMNLLCAFGRHPAGKAVEAAETINGGSSTETAQYNKGWDEEGNDCPQRVREDVQAVMTAVRERSEAQIEIETEAEYQLDLSGAVLSGTDLYYAKLIRAKLTAAKLIRAYLFSADLTGADLRKANLADANLRAAVLRKANLDDANLSGADLLEANLEGANLVGVDLTGANLEGANLTRATLNNCNGLRREQLDETVAREGFPPYLLDVVDTNTGIPLVWERRTVT